MSVARHAWRISTGPGRLDEFLPWTLSGYLVDYLVEWTELHGPKTDQELARVCTTANLEALESAGGLIR